MLEDILNHKIILYILDESADLILLRTRDRYHVTGSIGNSLLPEETYGRLWI
jgi:hypothetical protein